MTLTDTSALYKQLMKNDKTFFKQELYTRNERESEIIAWLLK